MRTLDHTPRSLVRPAPCGSKRRGLLGPESTSQARRPRELRRGVISKGARGLLAASVVIGVLVLGCASSLAATSSSLDADQILARASAGAKAPALVGASFPGASVRATPDVRLRVLVADLAPKVVLAAHGRPLIVAGKRRIALVKDHRYEISRRGRGWRLRDLDGSSPSRVLGPGPVRFVSVAARPTVLLADPLSRRFRGSLELRAASAARSRSSIG